jgi:hypothetical protein
MVEDTEKGIRSGEGIRSNVEVLHDTYDAISSPGEWQLCYQWCHWHYWKTPTGTPIGDAWGYRFIWRHPNGRLQAARGQARLPSSRAIMALMAQAHQEGWGELTDQRPHQM